MNISSSYGVAGNTSGYGTQIASQTSSKPFTIPTQEKSAQTLKVTQTFNPDPIVTFIGYGKFDPFKDMAETGSFTMPKFMQTKTTPTRSDEEILKEIEELAKEHARTGISRNEDERFAELLDEYVSSVSPDRESILKSKISEILERVRREVSGMEGGEKKEDMIDYLIELFDIKKGGKKEKNISDIINDKIAALRSSIAPMPTPSGDNIIAKYSNEYHTQIDYDRGGGNVTSLVYDNNGNLQPYLSMRGDMYDNVFVQNGVVESAKFYDDNGELIMNYWGDKFGFNQSYTKAEGDRLKELIDAYNAAYKV